MNDINAINTLRLLQAADEIKARLASEFSAVHGISVNEFFLLLHLERAALHRMPRVELAKRMHLSASTVTRMAAPLEKIGLVARQADTRDARLAFVTLTDAGRHKLAEAQTTFAKQAGTLFDERWTGDEQSQFSAMLYRLLSGTVGNLT